MQRNKSTVVEIVDTWGTFKEPWTRHNKGQIWLSICYFRFSVYSFYFLWYCN